MISYNNIALLAIVTVALGGQSVLSLASPSANKGTDIGPKILPGAQLYKTHCAQCHHASLRGTAHGSTLTGSAFLSRWSVDKQQALLAYNRANMPPGSMDQLSRVQHQAIVMYLMAANGIDIEEQQPEALDSWSDASTIDAIAKSRSAFANKSVSNFQPVTQAMLNSPAAADWLSWRRTLDGQGHSPLKQINRSNVGQLKLAWVLAMHDGSNQVTPLVYNGVMYLTHPGNIVQALNADTGELIWEYAHQFAAAAKTLGGPVRNIAIFQDKIFLSTYDASLVALNARTGELVWKAQKADYRSGYTHTSGPIIGAGVVLSGINGCERYKKEGCFITGHDANTGKELWRTSTIEMPALGSTKTLEADSWGDTPPEFRAGGDTWIAGSYDPKLNLFYIGTAQAKPWVASSRGMTTHEAALYTNSTLAINPLTGDIVWYFQHIPGETIDMEVGFERVLVDQKKKRWLFTVGKDGILWKLDRRNGKFLDHTETIEQNIFEHIDGKTGAVRYREDIRKAKIGDTINACPGIYGGHNWQAMAYSPEIASLIIPLHQLCADMVGREVVFAPGEGGFGGDSRSYEMPGSDGKLGKLVAVNTSSMKQRWSHEQRAMFMTGALTTAGKLVFIGDLDRYIKAFDVDNGNLLWQTRLGAPTHGYPISYAVNGKQYVAIPTGMGVFRALTAVISPDIYQPANGQALYVFELPDQQ